MSVVQDSWVDDVNAAGWQDYIRHAWHRMTVVVEADTGIVQVTCLECECVVQQYAPPEAG